jgi:predicted nucleotidyltransferase
MTADEKLDLSQLKPVTPAEATKILKKHAKREITLSLKEPLLPYSVLQSAIAEMMAKSIVRVIFSRSFKKEVKKRRRFPHLYREHYPKRRTRSMKGK